ncbi:Hypothetical predicted protein [Olea europaea subsp. europaea]|uniref:Uncharacterized protein n=1 Tax=Olea europaea subsp. europaea TaxID=158383 RepID=A0A8S0SUD4_OLEEU|nr:Hypothetical predicted protein [Olea europaea subsp. europaea]
MLSNSQDFQQKSFKILHDEEKFVSKLLSKEMSKPNPFFKVYYGDVSIAVPFMWETTLGTPKPTFSDNSIPPLTPPPSDYSNKNVYMSFHRHSRSNILYNFLTRMNLKKVVHVGSSPSLSSMPQSCHLYHFRRPLRCRYFLIPWHLLEATEEGSFRAGGCLLIMKKWEDLQGCDFCIRRDTGGRIVKKALLSIGNRGSG